eukprot:15466834-Alexandrium_andersonii.AAC.1
MSGAIWVARQRPSPEPLKPLGTSDHFHILSHSFPSAVHASSGFFGLLLSPLLGLTPPLGVLCHS